MHDTQVYLCIDEKRKAPTACIEAVIKLSGSDNGTWCTKIERFLPQDFIVVLHNSDLSCENVCRCVCLPLSLFPTLCVLNATRGHAKGCARDERTASRRKQGSKSRIQSVGTANQSSFAEGVIFVHYRAGRGC